ncbi:hypothetical protein SH1V18_47990 [Vallitalea longa]|uniref:Uncharacterized protein n=1 Tax=Vallitalea longa TaxID=2936439 RepID=A0A9W5YI29_9FIRM|nr:hypothetical protein [Vallitalea longa]GKX32319.1 hypothetical protein SH1V18_47990 [Vallitalea longa]
MRLLANRNHEIKYRKEINMNTEIFMSLLDVKKETYLCKINTYKINYSITYKECSKNINIIIYKGRKLIGKSIKAIPVFDEGKYSLNTSVYLKAQKISFEIIIYNSEYKFLSKLMKNNVHVISQRKAIDIIDAYKILEKYQEERNIKLKILKNEFVENSCYDENGIESIRYDFNIEDNDNYLALYIDNKRYL